MAIRRNGHPRNRVSYASTLTNVLKLIGLICRLLRRRNQLLQKENSASFFMTSDRQQTLQKSSNFSSCPALYAEPLCFYTIFRITSGQTAGAFFQRRPRPEVRANPRLRTKVTAITNGQMNGSEERMLHTRVPTSRAMDSDCPRRRKRR